MSDSVSSASMAVVGDPTARRDAPLAVFLTCAVSHVVIIPTLLMFWRRRWLYEWGFTVAGLVCSFMYHTCQAFNADVFMTELQWHVLDNVFVICGFINLFTYMTNFRSGKADGLIKGFGAFLAVWTQIRDPWNLSHTVVPIMLYGAMPFIWIGLIDRSVTTTYNLKAMAVGLGLLAFAVPFFILGLDDAHDPFRIFHGLWHVFIGSSCFYMWHIVRRPIATNLQSYVFGDGAGLTILDDGFGNTVPSFLGQTRRGLGSGIISSSTNGGGGGGGGIGSNEASFTIVSTMGGGGVGSGGNGTNSNNNTLGSVHGNGNGGANMMTKGTPTSRGVNSVFRGSSSAALGNTSSGAPGNDYLSYSQNGGAYVVRQ